jgi:FKBP-type peptidyl-prolyl cis-trans isomerase SlyD
VQIAKNAVVRIDYTLTNDAGAVLDTSKGREPLSYVHGAGGLIPGLEEELDGKQPGDSLQVVIPPDKAYGERQDGLVQKVEREKLPPEADVQIGMQFQAHTNVGVHVVTVTEIEGDEVTLDGNHPLAGETLHFDVNVVEVREATQEEIEHGHAHGAGGHAH